MGIYSGWEQMMQNTDSPEFEHFWNSYIQKEKIAYQKILSDTSVVYAGKACELAAEFDMELSTFAGFLDGINDSLVEPIDVPSVEEDSVVNLNIDFEKLYYDMHKAKADWLFNLKEWQKVLSDDKRKEITKKYRVSGQFINTSPKIGPNEPCPCGSGKKYKKCCGRLQD